MSSTSIKVVLVLGGPGSGKGTQCDQLVKKFSFVALSAGEQMRLERDAQTDLGKQIKVGFFSARFLFTFVPCTSFSCGLLLASLSKSNH
jgi:hypothetical protein